MSRTMYLMLLLVCVSTASPVEFERNSQGPKVPSQSSSQSKDRLRQDGDGGDGGDAPDLGGQVGSLLEGFVTGDFTSILGSAAGFIPDEGTQEGVNTIFQAVAPFLNSGLATAVNTTKEYVNPSTKAPTKAPAVAQFVQVAGPGGVPVLIQLPPTAQQQAAVAASATEAPKPPSSTDEDDDDEDTLKRLL